MRIGITINEVYRDHIFQFHQVYEKYVAKADINHEDILTDDLSQYFKFSNDENYKKFIYESASVEVFGFADLINSTVFEDTNEFLFDFYADKGNSITLISKEFNRSIGATLFWLSKVNSNFKDISFMDTYEDVWENYDLIISATPEILLSKPEGKISIKIDASYNKDIEADYSFEKINDLFGETDELNKIIKNNKNK